MMSILILGFWCVTLVAGASSQVTSAPPVKMSEHKHHAHHHQHSSAEAKEASSKDLELNYSFASANLDSLVTMDFDRAASTSPAVGESIQPLKFVFNGKRSPTFTSGQCINPSPMDLDKTLTDYHAYLRRFEETILPTKYSNVESAAASGGKQGNARLIDQSQCNANERNMTTINQQSLCPWKYVVTHRPDRYPVYRVEVKCTCDTCTTWAKGVLAKTVYGCQPVYTTQPVLVRGACRADGRYQWIPKTEEVSVACVCAFAHNHLVHW